MTKKVSLFLAALVAAIVGIGALLVPAQAAEKLGTARGWCVKSSTGELRTLRLTTAGKCQPGYWGPISLASGVKGPAGPAGPKGDKGDPGEGGTVVLCTAGYASRDIVVSARIPALISAEAAARAELSAAEAAKTKAEGAADVAQKSVDTAQTTLTKALSAEPVVPVEVASAQTALAAAVSARDAAVKTRADASALVIVKQKAADAAETAAEAATVTSRTCVKG